jgi:PKD repeat protein
VTKQVVITGIEGGEEAINDVEDVAEDVVNDEGDVAEEAIQVDARFFASVRLVNNQAQVTLNNRSENATSFQWTFPGGTPSSSTLENPVVTYPNNGVFTVTLVASNGDVSDTTTQRLTINNIPEEDVEEPEVDVRARFFVSVRRSNGQFRVTMRNRSTNATDFQWSFPGGSPETSTEENPTVIYTEGGTRNITLVASNGDVSSTRTVTLRL